MIVGDIVERNARLSPHQPAVVCGTRRLTHAALAERARRLANALHARGLRRGDRVAVLAQNCPEYLEAYAASELSGFITVTVNYRLAPPEVAFILQDSQPAALLFEAPYAALVAQVRPSLAAQLHYVSIGEAIAWAEEYEALLASAATGPLAERPGGEDTVYLMYTSGTTGTPKGVCLSQRAMAHMALVTSLESDVVPTDRVLLTMPLYHIGAKCTQLAYHLRGCMVVLHRTFDPRAVLETIATERITATLLAPTMLRALLDLPDFDRYDRSSLRSVFYSAAPMPVDLLRRGIAAFGPIFMQLYGMTEIGAIGTGLHKHQHVLDGDPIAVRRLASAGQPLVTCEVRVVRDDGTDCAPGEPGEVLVRSPAVMQGYWNNPAATAEVLHDGWLHTGDIGTLDAEHYLFIVDRKKDMIVSGGENIYPREVETALETHPAVREAAVIGVPDEYWGEAVKAFVVLAPGASVTEAELIEHTRRQIASYKKPRSIEFVSDLPRLPNGKVRKSMLRAPYWTDRERAIT
ncbi:MAG TPA: long-chain fatty acid--CoA ligase [Chloroflexota bacterium]|nr:long-chain fatty acid--CoA ligase [Chloroflexota bacterium]